MSTSSKPQLTAKQIQALQAKFTRFRILVIGRANAGKTTILQRLCNAMGEPTIFNPDGEMIESSALNPSRGRGQHDIKNEITFESNPGFLFHDSPGFEAGGAQELKTVQEFIKERSNATKVNEQLHTIWYCIPTSDGRPITTAEKKFFNECGTGLVPVIVLWTKTESLDVAKIKQLMKEGNSRSEAMQQAPEKAWTDFEQSIHEQFEEFKYPPKTYVVFRKMHEPGADCKDLIEKTTAALSSEELQQLFLSTQQNVIELCIKYGVKRLLNKKESTLLRYFRKIEGNWAYFMGIVLRYFPQLRISLKGRKMLLDNHGWLNNLKLRELLLGGEMEELAELGEFEESYEELEEEYEESELMSTYREYYKMNSISKIMSPILSSLSTKFNLKEVTYCAIVAAIIGHLYFTLHQESPRTRNSLKRAVQIYQQSTCDASVKQAIEKIFELENLFNGSHIKSHIKSPFKHFLHVDEVDHKLLVEEAVQTALNNLLSGK